MAPFLAIFLPWEGMRGGESGGRGGGGGGERERERKKLLTFTNNVFTIYNMGHAGLYIHIKEIHFKNPST